MEPLTPQNFNLINLTLSNSAAIVFLTRNDEQWIVGGSLHYFNACPPESIHQLPAR
jgi:hypothetical protein